MDGSLTRSFAQSAGLAFLNSIVPARGVARDQLQDGRGLVTWLNRVGLAPEREVQRRWLERHADELDSVAERARRLRGWFQGFVRESLGRPLTCADLGKLRRLNSLVQEQRRFYQVVEADGGALALRFSSPWSTPESALIRIAEVLALFVCEVDFTRAGGAPTRRGARRARAPRRRLWRGPGWRTTRRPRGCPGRRVPTTCRG
jgi:hypothetical protein